MKKNLITISLLLISIILICTTIINMTTKASKATLSQNAEYEMYLEDVIYGTDVITLINKSISSNEENKVKKDEKDCYISNEENSILIDLIMITDEEKNETTTYKMETISKVGISQFVKNFNATIFKCTKKEYHKSTGKIAYIEITQHSAE